LARFLRSGGRDGRFGRWRPRESTKEAAMRFGAGVLIGIVIGAIIIIWLLVQILQGIF
jgi:hypothetical protein